MMIFGSGVSIAGGFVGTRMLTGYYHHGDRGQLLSSAIFQDFSDIDPPEIPPVSLPSAPTNVLCTVVDEAESELPSIPTSILITVEDA